MTLINQDVTLYLVQDAGPTKELEEIHSCSECDQEFTSYLDAEKDHLVILGTAGPVKVGEKVTWTIAVGCEGYYQLGGRFE